MQIVIAAKEIRKIMNKQKKQRLILWFFYLIYSKVYFTTHSSNIYCVFNL